MDQKNSPTDLVLHKDNMVFRVRSNSKIRYDDKVDLPEVHAHHYDEFHYVYNGSVTLLLADSKPDVVLNKGDFCVIPAGIYHCGLSDGVDRIIFPMYIESENSNKKSPDNTYDKLRVILDSNDVPFVINDPNIVSVMEQYRNIRESIGLCSEIHVAVLLVNAALYALKNICEENVDISEKAMSNQHSHLTDKRRAIIQSHIDDFFNAKNGLRTLAQKLYLSERRTSEIVQEIMGKNFKELVVQERMTVASILIKSRKYSLERIGEMVGYHSYSGFYTAYKNYFGHPPTNDVL